MGIACVRADNRERTMADASHAHDHSEYGLPRGSLRVTGVAGIAFCAWYAIAATVYAGLLPMPAFSDSDSYQLGYFADNTTALVLHAWLSGVFWVLALLTFAAGLRRELASAGPRAGMWADLAFAGALLATAVGGVGVAIQTAATSVSGNAADGIVPTFGRLLAVIDETLLYWGLAAFVGGASIAVLQAGSRRRWIAWFGLVDLALLVIGAAWPLTGDDRDLVGVIGLLGLFGAGVWVLLVAVSLLRTASVSDRPPRLAASGVATGSTRA
jgi:hypothetical protein